MNTFEIFQAEIQLEHLQEAIEDAVFVIQTIEEHREQDDWDWNNLGLLLANRHSLTGNVGDLHKAIKCIRRAIDITAHDDPNLAAWLNNLANKLNRNYETNGDIRVLHEAIQISRKALQLTPEDHPNLSGRLNNLGNGLSLKYRYTRSLHDLNEAIQYARRAVVCTAINDPCLASMMSNLAVNLVHSYEHTNAEDLLDEALQLAQRAVSMTQEDDLNYPVCLSTLANILQSRHELKHTPEDLEKSICAAERVVKLTFLKSPDLPAHLNNLSNKLKGRYLRTGQLEDLEGALRVAQRAIENAPEHHSELAGFFYTLGSCFELRHKLTGRFSDLEKGLDMTRKAIKLFPENHAGLILCVTGLAALLTSKWERTKNIDDLEQAIELARRGAECSEEGDADLASKLNVLGICLSHRYELLGNTEDLEEAIKAKRRAIQFVGPNHPLLPWLLSNIGNDLSSSYDESGDFRYLEEAAEHARRSVKLTPSDHPIHATALVNLGNTLMRFESVHDSDIIDVYLRAWSCNNAVPFIRIYAAIHAVELLQRQEKYDEAYTICLNALDIIPQVHNRSLNQQDQQCVVSEFSGLAPRACSLALQLGQHPRRALEVLEQGRTVIIDLLMDDKCDLSQLTTAYPDLCAKYERLRSEINAPLERVEDQHILNAALARRPKATEELAECAQEIRQLPGFDDFQKPLTQDRILATAKDGCIVVVNVTDLRSDAIILSEGRCVAMMLPEIDVSTTQDWIKQNSIATTVENRGAKTKAYRRFLSWLWQGCVRRVLDEMDYNVRYGEDDLPRIWWIGTGLAASFPFHAACQSTAEASASTEYRAISSYCSSIKLLARKRQRGPSSPLSMSLPAKLLIVTMATTPQADDLREAKSEKEAIVEITGSSTSVRTLDNPDVITVLKEIRVNDIVHFACHGVSDSNDPSQSGLLLQTTDKETSEPIQDILTVHKLSQANLQQSQLAYLSACSTAEPHPSKLVDEALHVVSGCEVAGFRHVVGCMWPSDDNVCKRVAKLFYSELHGRGFAQCHDKHIALALHKAVMKVRGDEEYRKRPLFWAQYVHFGP